MNELILSPGYQRPPLEQLPEGWAAKQLRDFCKVQQGGRLGITKNSGYESSGFPAFSAAGQDGYVEVAEFKNTKAVVLSAIGANCGRCFYAEGDWTTLANVQAIIPDGTLDASFLFYRANRDSYWTRSGSAQPFIKPSSVGNCWIAFPTDKHVQRKIVRILQTIDQAIEHTTALIDKYQQIKAGLMHDLFTRGISPDGKLRPPREQAPELYQQTPIGWIPKEWEFSSCEEVCEQIIDCKNRTPPVTPDGYPVIRTPNVRNGSFVDDELLYTDYESYVIWTARGKPRPGDIVITREAPVGEVCKIPERHREACLGQRMMLYRPNVTKIDSDFLLFALQSLAVQNRLDLISGGSTVGHVRVGDIRSLWISLPKQLEEQIAVAELLKSASNKLQAEFDMLHKLREKKVGLMHDLLTGKVSVTSNTDTKEAADVQD